MSGTRPGGTVRPDANDKCPQPPLRDTVVSPVYDSGAHPVATLAEPDDKVSAFLGLEKWRDVLDRNSEGLETVATAENLECECVARIATASAVQRRETLARRPRHEHIRIDPSEIDLANVPGYDARGGKIQRERLSAGRVIIDGEDAAVTVRTIEAKSEPSGSTEQVDDTQLGHDLRTILAHVTDGY